jgi:MoxR-like ATPase
MEKMTETRKAFEEYGKKIEQQKEEIRKRIIGLPKLLEALFICFYSHSERKLGPHLLVEGQVGKGKTATLDAFSRTISGAKFNRIQFTPDLKPLDLIRVVEQHEDRTLEFHPGPLFSISSWPTRSTGPMKRPGPPCWRPWERSRSR